MYEAAIILGTLLLITILIEGIEYLLHKNDKEEDKTKWK